jgi:hypothetical protein
MEEGKNNFNCQKLRPKSMRHSKAVSLSVIVAVFSLSFSSFSFEKLASASANSTSE